MFEYFYHQKIRKAVAMFGTMFNNINVVRTDANGGTLSQVRVPLAYAPREKYLARIQADPDLRENTRVALKLPRLAFEITSISYDPNRKIPKLNRFSVQKKGQPDRDLRGSLYSPVPYIISFQLNAFTKTQDDALQIVEQIIPYFAPQYTLTIKPFAEYPTIKEDVPITIQGVNFQDDFEGSLEQRRTIIYSMDFTMNINFYGPIREASLINRATGNLETGDSAGVSNIVQKVIVTPNPADASPDETFGFAVSTLENFAPDLTELGQYFKKGYVNTNYVEDKTVK
tara:strand:+ start:194 stop:1048 length:855 start_codon:yes stop_codon:yes gene_type:complete